jgi:hypothetical protein
MKIEVTTHNEILEDPIVELDKTIDMPKNETFIPCIVLVDKDDSRRRFAQYLPEQPYINGTWTDEDVQIAVDNYLKAIEIK